MKLFVVFIVLATVLISTTSASVDNNSVNKIIKIMKSEPVKKKNGKDKM